MTTDRHSALIVPANGPGYSHDVRIDTKAWLAAVTDAELTDRLPEDVDWDSDEAVLDCVNAIMQEESAGDAEDGSDENGRLCFDGYREVTRDNTCNSENDFDYGFTWTVYAPVGSDEWAFDDVFIAVCLHRGGDPRGNYGDVRLYRVTFALYDGDREVARFSHEGDARLSTERPTRFLQAIFCPDASVYCVPCQNEHARQAIRAAEATGRPTWAKVFPEDGIDLDQIGHFHEVTCDRCGLTCFIGREDVAICQRFVTAARETGFEWNMTQTGGMYVAAELETRDCNGGRIRILVTEDTENPGRVIVGAYDADDDDFTEWGVVDNATFEKAIAWVEAVCEGGDAYDLYESLYGPM